MAMMIAMVRRCEAGAACARLACADGLPPLLIGAVLRSSDEDLSRGLPQHHESAGLARAIARAIALGSGSCWDQDAGAATQARTTHAHPIASS